MELISNLQPKQVEAARYWLDNSTDEILFGGAKGGSKSYLGCNLIFSDALTYPGTHYFIARHNLTDLKKFTTPSIYEVFEHWGIRPEDYMKFNGQENYFELNNGSKVYYLDCRHLPSDPDFHRFGSMQFTRGWCEEIGQISDKAIVNLSASIGRWKNNDYNLSRKLLLTCNPNKGYAYREFFIPSENNELEPYRKFIRSLPTDNKYLSKAYLEALNRLPKDERARLLFGDWRYDDDPTKLIEYDKIMDLWSNTHVLPGKKYITADIARYGKDKTVIMVWDGLQVVHIKTINKSDLIHVADVIKALKLKYHVPMSNVYVDEAGLGSGVVDMLPGCKGFVANRKPINSGSRENYDNIKSQCGFKLADYVNGSLIWVRTESNKNEVIEELEQIKKKKEDTDDKWGLIRKEEMKDKLGRSPDYQDCFIMRMVAEIGEADYFK